LKIRRERSLGSGALTWNESPAGVLDFTVADVRVVSNMTDGAVALPSGDLLLASGPLEERLPADTTVWLSV